MTEELLIKGTLAKDAAMALAGISAQTKIDALEAIAQALIEHTDEILAANTKDIACLL